MKKPSSSQVWFDRPGETWFEGLPLGNGRSGAMVYGDLPNQILALNDELFWSPGPRDRDLAGAQDAMSRVRQLLADGDVIGAQSAAAPMLGTPHLGAALQPLGSVRLSERNLDGEGPQFYRELDLSRGVATFRWEWADGSSIERTILAARTPSVFFVRQAVVGRSSTTEITFDSDFPVGVVEFDDRTTIASGQWTEVAPNRVLVADSYRLPGRLEDPHLRFAMGVRRLSGDGLLAVAVGTNFHGGDASQLVLGMLDQAAENPDDAIAAAITTHSEAFERSSICLQSKGPAAAPLAESPTDARIHAVRAGGIDDDLTVLLADYGRYLVIASSLGAETPPTLQGVWNEDTEPAWSSNWTTNINLQMNLWSADTFHLTESTDTLFELVERVAEAGERTAREIYGADGWVVHHNIDIWPNTSPNTMVEIGLFPGAGPWLLQQLWQHHIHYPERNTGDRLFRLLEGCAAFLETWLVEDDEGFLVTSPSSTPENAYLLGDTERPPSRSVDPDYSRHGWLGRGPSLDQWLVRDTLRTVIELAVERHFDQGRVDRWSAMLARLRPVPIADGMIPEWTRPYRTLEVGHRHLSALYPVYPGNDDYRTPSDWKDAAVRGLLDRQLHVESSSNGWGGWSKVWTAAAWARLGDGDRALASLEQVVRTGVAPGSLLHAFPDFDGRPGPDAVHQSDANMGFPAAVAELVLQSSPGRITLLAALPTRWRSGEVRNLRAADGIDVSFSWADGALITATLSSTKDQTTTVRAPVVIRGVPTELALEIELVAGSPRILAFTNGMPVIEKGILT